MSKIKIKNLFDNALISYIKDNNIKFHRVSIQDTVEGIVERLVFTTTDSQKLSDLSALLRGEILYHNTSIDSRFKIKNIFNYNSNQYENISTANTELELPLFYIENVNPDNERNSKFKALKQNRISKDYFLRISDRQDRIPSKNSFEKQKMSNILFCNDYNIKRNKEEKQNIPYFNDFSITTENSTTIMGDFLKEIKFQEEFLSCLETFTQTETVNFLINTEAVTSEASLNVVDLHGSIINGNTIINEDNKIILSKEKNISNTMNNSFKKFLLLNFIRNKKHLLKDLQRILQNEECEKEFIIYKVEKYRDTDGIPIQSFWMFEENFKEYLDLQIKRDTVYRYEFKPFVLIYGTAVRPVDPIISNDRLVVDLSYLPSFKIAQVSLDSKFVKVNSHVQLPPYVKVINESNSENYIKIYLDLKKGSYKENFEYITPYDRNKMNYVEYDSEGKTNFEYFTQQGAFEVFRHDELPKNIYEFENKKILNIESKYYSTSVVFKDKILPNKKYYYIFRALNIIGIPSNPTKIYEVELIKDSNSSKIHVKTIDTNKEFTLKDKKMKRLLQIKPSFEQRVFDDRNPIVSDLASYKKNTEKLSLGSASDKIWCKKMKIRIKSKDTGKIIDLNIKFNVVKDNII